MTTITALPEPRTDSVQLGLRGISKPQGAPTYAIAFDMDIESLPHYGDPYNNA